MEQKLATRLPLLGKGCNRLLKRTGEFALLLLLFIYGSIGYAQQPTTVEIKGTVTDESSEPVYGAMVTLLKNKKLGVSTNEKGEFVLRIPQSDIAGESLIISFIGMKTQQVAIDTRSNYSIVLREEPNLVGEVVVTGYQTLSKERATGAFDILPSAQLERPATNIADRLVGTVSGMQTRLDGNGKQVLEIRGQTSLNVEYTQATSSTVINTDNVRPLIVVDGFPVDGEFSSINPNDVESITILKDAAAASIWGARSANGVIVITTKSGAKSKVGGVNVDFSVFHRISSKVDLGYYNPLASTSDVIDYEQRGFASNFFGGPWPPIANDYTKAASGYSAAMVAMNEHRLGFITEAEMNAQLDKLRGYNNQGQLEKYLFQNPTVSQYNLNISTSTERSNNVFSLMYENEKGNFKTESEDRFMFNYRTNVKLAKWVDFNFGGMVQYNNASRNSTSVLVSTNASGADVKNKYNIIDVKSLMPYDMLIDEQGNRTDIPKTFYKPILDRLVPTDKFPYDDWSFNPITNMESATFNKKDINFRIQTGLTFKIIKGLTFDSKVQYEMYTSKTKDIYTEGFDRVRNAINTASTWDKATNKVTANLPKGGIRDMSDSQVSAANFRNQLNYTRTFANLHDISVIAGTEVRDRVTQSTTSPTMYGYNDETLSVGIFPNGPGGAFRTLTNWQGSSITFPYTNIFRYGTERYFSLYGNASYTYNGKYTLSGSLRTDASNMISDDPKYRYAPFWSVGLGWQLSKEQFMSSLLWVNRLNLRLTYGYNGNVDRSTSFRPLINYNTTTNQYILDNTATISSYGNPSLRWERTRSTNFGVDYALFGGKLFGKVDVYDKKGSDLIVSMSIPSVNGTATQKLNRAKMTNRGIEVELGTSLPIGDNGVTWWGNVNFAYNKNRITELYKATYSATELYQGGTSSYVQGANALTLWVFKYAGVVNEGTAQNPNMQPMVQGKGSELYGFGAFTSGDGRDFMLNGGTLVAPYTLGITSGVRLYNFDVSLIIVGKFGHVFKRQSFNYPSMSDGRALPNNKYQEVLNGDPMKVVPIPFGKEEPRYYFWDRFYPYVDYLVESASHVRLSEVNITYNLPKSVVSKVGLNGMKVFVQGDNLLSIFNNKYNEDPEYPMGGFNLQRSFYMGLKVSF